MRDGKVWGVTELLLRSPMIEVHRITVEPNRRCSKHHHERKHNAFYVESGALFIQVWKSYGLVDETELRAGQIMTVGPGEKHRFVTKDLPAKALEIYYCEPLGLDIVRDDCGGINETVDRS